MATTRRPALLTPLLLLLLAPALRAEGGGEVRVVKDQKEREVRISLPVTRVVCLAPNVTEILFAIGAGEMIVGRDSYSDYPPEAKEKVPSVGSDYEPSIERIVGLRPQVVFTATTANRQETVEGLERLGIPVFTTHSDTLAEMDATIRAVGKVVGRDARAEELVASIHDGLDAIRKAAAPLPKVRALVVVWSDPLFVAGPSTHVNELLEAAGGTNVASDAGDGFPRYPMERVLRLDPAVIVVSTHPADPTKPTGFWARWDSLAAVKAGRVHTFDGDIVVRPGPRVVDGARRFFELLHPTSGPAGATAAPAPSAPASTAAPATQEGAPR